MRKNKTGSYLLFLFFILLCVVPDSTKAYNLRQYSSKNGLSNSAILSIYQDRKGYMWFGSCDGLNLFDGLNIQVYKPTDGNNNLSGNLIESIIEAEDNVFWIQTNYGLDRFDRRGKKIESHKEFKSRNFLSKTTDNDILIVKENKYICYIRPQDKMFKKIFIEELYFDDILDMVIDKNNTLWIFSKEGNCLSFLIEKDNEGIRLKPAISFQHEKKLQYVFHEDNIIYFIDDEFILYEYDLISKKKYYVHDLRSEILQKGEVSSIIKSHHDYYIGFKATGLIHLKNISDRKNNYQVQEIDIKSGVFCLIKDKNQNIIWVGTDGQGVYMYFTDSYSVKSTTFNNQAYSVNNPVRALFLDKERTLWVGTKGDGILKVSDYNYEKNINGKKTEHILSGNSQLNDNSVYTFEKSHKNILWIGNENGINYYSYKERKIKRLNIEDDGKPVKYVHSICEFNDSTLWIATVGDGIIKARLSGSDDVPVITDTKRILIDQGKRSSNYFFTTYKENDSIIWFGNRGYGAFKLDSRTEKLEQFQFDKSNSNQTLNDIFSITKNDESYWFGTSFGLIRLQDGKEQIFNETNGFPNNTIHAILEDDNNNLWLSSNQGVVKFNVELNTFQIYKNQNELEVTEFSDGAYFKDDATGSLFLGGINGFITISPNNSEQREYVPPIQFNTLSIFGKEKNIFDFLSYNKDIEVLNLNYAQNFFSISFTAIDYINGNNYTYMYKLDELSNNWIENSNSNSAVFTDISPGQYTLYVKYKNRIDGNESPVYALTIKIHPPWYRTNLAYFIYANLFLVLLYMVIRISLKWYRMKRDAMFDKLNRQQKEEVYESKLRFFTNITHELCTPLTLIYGPCERIISYNKTDSYVRKYATLIQYNAEKLNGLIQELIEFRRLETGNKVLEIRQLQVSEIMADIAESFEELGETKNIDYKIDIEANISWDSDNSCLVKIVTNLISNAFKYTEEGGEITVNVRQEYGLLNIHISNTGKGIKEEDIPKIFDRYKILDSFEISKEKGTASRNGLGLAICHSMVKLLNGEIQVKSNLNELTTFTVTLPVLDANIRGEDVIPEEELPYYPINETSLTFNNSAREYDKGKLSMMIIDDDPAMLWFVSEIFVEQYNVIPVSDSEQVLEILTRNQPDLIISDVMMPGIDGITLAKSIKSNKLLNHIPLILLSAKNDPNEQVRGIESGAEMYITKPFNVEYLEKIVTRLLQRKEDLKEYYHSSLSAFELGDGQFVHKEDKAFFEKMIQFIDSNIMNPEMSVELLSSSLGYSTRQLYRKLKNITPKTPNDIIREYRLSIAEQLLTTTNMSIDEILYKSGFNNRGNFFKLFSQKHGVTPKAYREEKKKEFDDSIK